MPVLETLLLVILAALTAVTVAALVVLYGVIKTFSDAFGK